MPALDIHGIKVEFPFTAYEVQKSYMTKVIQALNTHQNAALESPTGTGKTLCLLCSTLAWRRQHLNELKKHANPVSQEETWSSSEKSKDSAIPAPKIIYASRTHSQISQVVKELKRTEYGKDITISILGSREQMCIHPEVSKQTSNQAMVHMCRGKINKHTCQFYNNVEDAKKNNIFTTKVMDIEELVTVGKSRTVCPYYSEREVSKQNECGIIFTPYNYLLDRKSRATNNLEIRGNIVIFDEAHNLEKLCEESTSFDLTSLEVAKCIEEVGDVLDAATKFEESGTVADGHENGESSSLSEFKSQDLAIMKSVFIALEKLLDQVELNKDTKSRSEPGKFMFEFLSKINLTESTYQIMLDVVDKISTYLSTLSNSLRIRGAALQKFSEIVKVAFSWMEDETKGHMTRAQRMQELCMCYRVHICENAETGKSADVWKRSANTSSKPGRTISFWCFSPGYAMTNLVKCGVRNLILTSGTLSPLESFTSELQIDFPITLENDHVIDKHQVFVITLTHGKKGGLLNSTFKTRKDVNQVQELGLTVADMIAAAPGGALVFFPSYSAMAEYLTIWKENSNVMTLVEKVKPCTVEPKNKHELRTAIDKYYTDVNTGGGTFLAVCRGKVSEGLDFSDDNGRTVIIVGIPYPPAFDPRIKMKMAFLDDLRTKGATTLLTGREWYRQQACRAVNQAIGRVIRHRYDYGAIVLCDHRYAGRDQLSELPKWVQPHVVKFNNAAKCIRRLRSFFCSVNEKEKNRLKEAYEYCEFDSKAETSSCKSLSPKTGIATNVKTLNSNKRAKVCIKYSESDQHNNYDMYMSPVSISQPTSTKKRKISSIEKSGPAKQKKSLLDALDNIVSDDEEISDENNSAQNNMPTATTIPDIRKFKQRKKIIVKKKGTQFETSKENTKQESSNNSNQALSFDSTRLTSGPYQYYIECTKSTLSTPLYLEFKKAARDYTKNGDVETVFNSLHDVFMVVGSQHPELLSSFVRFIRAEHRAQYTKLCSARTKQSISILAPQLCRI
ncbi:regulator of telomere elongation helicase 1 isoform X1 [Ciona intestinalis]